jgi:AcrR family transcriptional regulator
MRYLPEQGARTRKRIVQSARVLFNRHGFEAVSIDRIMAHAGLTRGGFYRHFRSKGDLYAAALEDALRRPLHGVTADCAANDVGRRLIDTYLSRKHMDGMDLGCPLVTLPGDVARADPAVKRVFQSIFVGMSDLFQRSLRESGLANGSERALAVTALCVGSMTVCRGLEDRELGDAVRAASRRLALEVCRLEETGSRRRSVRKASPRRAASHGR